MRLSKAKQKYFPLLLVLILFTPGITRAATHAITPSGAGTSSGADWNNSCAGFTGNCAPGSMVRGDTYYVGAGTYTFSAALTFAVAESGTLVITIQAPTAADHGPSAGWNAGTMQGQAVFTGTVGTLNVGPDLFVVNTSYWVFNGVYNDCGTYLTEPFLPCRTGYGFKIENNNGSNKPFFSQGIGLSRGFGPAVNNVTFEFFEYAGDADPAAASYCVQGYHAYSPITASSTNDSLLYSYFHDTSNGPAYMDGTTNFVFDHNWMARDGSNGATCHSEIAFRSAASIATANITFSYNYFENLQSTAMIATPETNNVTVSGVNIYGNTFFCNTAETAMGAGFVANCPGGDGFIFLFEGTFNNVNVYNNTFDGKFGTGAARMDIGDGVATTVNTLNFQNNIFSHQSGAGLSCGSPAICNGITWSHTSYLNGTPKSSGDTDPNAQVSAANPYINASTNTANANNYHLATNTSMWRALTSPYDVDSSGITRTSSRGAFQMASAEAARPNPPTSLTVIVQ